jgi:hypothetical protein
MKSALALGAAAAIAIAACDNPLVPDDTAGIYRLESINGAHVPAALAAQPFGFGNFVERADLLILPAGHFELQVAALYPADLIGSARVAGHVLSLEWQLEGDTTHFTAAGTTGGDSLAVILGTGGAAQTMVFRRFARRPPALSSGTFVLSTINGAAVPAAIADVTSGGVRYVQRVDYDSIMLRDGLFFTRSRKMTLVGYQPTGDSALSLTSSRTFGDFTSEGNRLVLSDAWLNNAPLGASIVADTFATSAAGFTATHALPAPYTAVYTRR